ncbi:hypothetical protein P4200_30415 [Pseudomonas aeruginosa]|nr:hypothetical protein [Pseudomonas aeruginosa]
MAALADVLVVIDNPAVALDVGGIEAEAVGGRTAFAGTGGDGDLALSAARIVEQAAVATGAEAGFLVAARQKVAIAFLLAKIAEVGRDQLDRQGFALSMAVVELRPDGRKMLLIARLSGLCATCVAPSLCCRLLEQPPTSSRLMA